MSRSFFKVEVEVRTERDIDEYEVPRYLRRQEEDFVKIDRIEAFYPRDFWRRVNRAAQKYDLYRIRIQDQAHWLIATVSGGAGEPTTRKWWMERMPPYALPAGCLFDGRNHQDSCS